MSRLTKSVEFHPTGDTRIPWEASDGGERWQVRVNEFPEEGHLYSLLVDGKVVEEFQEWPAAWARTNLSDTGSATHEAIQDAGPDVDPYQQREYEIELEKFERSQKIGPSRLFEPAGKPSASPDAEGAQSTQGADDTAAPDSTVWWKSVDELFSALEAEQAADLARAERRSAASGREPFSLARLEELLGEDPGSLADSEASLRSRYYIVCPMLAPEVRTLAGFAKYIREMEVWK